MTNKQMVAKWLKTHKVTKATTVLSQGRECSPPRRSSLAVAQASVAIALR